VEGRNQLFLAEDGFGNLRIYSGLDCLVATSLFKVHIPSACWCIRFGTEFARTETDDKVKLGQIF